MDVLAAGPIVGEISSSFDLYWNSRLAYPAAALGAAGDPQLLATAREKLAEEVSRLAASRYGQRLRESDLAADMERGQLALYWARAELLSDLPEKVVTDPDDRSTHLGPELQDLLQSAERRLIAISPYFVPGKRGTELLTGLAKRGVDVTIVTNSLASTDVPAVHAGYIRYRRRLLEAGIEIYETRPSPPLEDDDRRFGDSQASLHAKTFAIDDRQVLVGSMNFDPRSDLLNTEMGILINSAEFAAAMSEWRRDKLPDQAWQVILEDTPSGTGLRRLRWTARDDGGETLITGTEPQASIWRRMTAALLRFLPIEKQL
jgi:putative cardiolipin synthase